MTHAVFQPLPAAGDAGFRGGLSYAVTIRGVDLIAGLRAQLFGGISQHSAVGRTVVQATPLAIDDGDHIGGVLADQVK